MPTRLRIGIDVDDVLAESLPGYVEAFRQCFGLDVRIEEAAWEIFRRYPQISATQMWGFFSDLEASDFLGTRPVYPEAVRAVKAMASDGHRLFVVTGRLSQHREHTRRLLEGAGLLEFFEELVHREQETAPDYKSRIVREMKLDLLIEDELHVALAAAAVPIPVLLFDRPWNQAELPAGITRVTDWDQALRLVAAQASARTR
ncbi:MAG TPA: HAD family hydrolase [Candidatus Acidoferrum sp.]|nr:HAD family hydrolase [Candidatus Acidoferrum sp.]